MKKSPILKDLYDKAIKRWKENKQKEKTKSEADLNQQTPQNGSFTTVANTMKTESSLYRCWMLDSGSDTHVINHYGGLTNVRIAPETAILNSGKDTYQIEAYGDAEVLIDTPQGKTRITLLNVAYIPGYLTNIVAMIRLSRGGVH